jgi:hypothetical protein
VVSGVGVGVGSCEELELEVDEAVKDSSKDDENDVELGNVLQRGEHVSFR